ncbi:hypothetical protein ACO0LF_19375 [Undibacterium sp. Di27W]|uniref:hypothetical protein n=1 Tax=Undibacterium sp. Di27W TaxID=3413036 RepID=UPI003BF32CEE
MPWSVVAAVGGAFVSGIMNDRNSSSQQQTQTQQQQLDPRIAAMLFGSGEKTLKAGAKPTGMDENGNPTYAESDYNQPTQGLLSRYQGLLDKPQNLGLQLSGTAADNYVGANSAYDFGQQRMASLGLMNDPFSAPQMNAAQGYAAQGIFTNPMMAAQGYAPNGYNAEQARVFTAAPAAQINAPSQNDLNLNPALGNIINGDLGNNPYLAGAIQKGLNQSSANFQNLKDDMLTSFKQDLLPSIRGDAIVNGQYGGSRQGLAEGKAADSLTRNLTRALSQVGQNQTDAAVQAQSQQYAQDRQNQLSAAMGLSGQQYGVSGANAAATNQVNLANAGMINQGNQFNANSTNQAQQQAYQGQLSTLMQNSQFQQQANSTNYQGNQQMNLQNLGNRQQINMQNLANQQQANQYNTGMQFNTHQLNSQNRATGAGLLGSVQNNAYNQAQNANDYLINQAGKINALLAPYIGANSSSVSSAPLYQNQGANILGGALAGAQLFKQFNSDLGSNGYGKFLSNNADLMNNQGLSPADLTSIY